MPSQGRVWPVGGGSEASSAQRRGPSSLGRDALRPRKHSTVLMEASAIRWPRTASTKTRACQCIPAASYPLVPPCELDVVRGRADEHRSLTNATRKYTEQTLSKYHISGKVSLCDRAINGPAHTGYISVFSLDEEGRIRESSCAASVLPPRPAADIATLYQPVRLERRMVKALTDDE